MQLTKLKPGFNTSAANSSARASQRHGYKTGEALSNHVAQHGGVINQGCRACAEIVRKMEKSA